MSVHFYMTCYRVEALIASHLEPEEFGRYMAVGRKNLTSGHVMFFEVDPELKNDRFDLKMAADACKPHADGAPKRSLYLGIYRVLESVPTSAIGNLYLVTRDGRMLEIAPQAYEDDSRHKAPFLYQELSPVSPLVATSLPPLAFCRYLTNPTAPVSVPRVCFADLRLNREKLNNMATNLPYRNPEHIQDCLNAVSTKGSKDSKIVDRDHSMEFFYRAVDQGFFLGDRESVVRYPFPTQEQFQDEYHMWWRSASMGL